MDEGLRELERRWQASGSVEDEASFLRGRVRAGALPETALTLAAYAGHPAARLVTGTEARALDRGWIEGLEPWGRPAWVRAALAAARASWPREVPAHPSRSETCGVVERWLAEPAAPPGELARFAFFDAEAALLVASGEARPWNQVDISTARQRKGGVAENAVVGLSLAAAHCAWWALTSEAPGGACFIACRASALAVARYRSAAEAVRAIEPFLEGSRTLSEEHHAALAERLRAIPADLSAVDEVVRGEVAAWALGDDPTVRERLRAAHRARVTPPDPCACLPKPGTPEARERGVTWKAHAESQRACKVHRKR